VNNLSADQFKAIVDTIFGYSQSTTISSYFFVIEVLLILILMLWMEYSKSKKSGKKEFDIFSCFMQTIISSIFAIIILLIFGKETIVALLFSTAFGFIVGVFVYNNYLMRGIGSGGSSPTIILPETKDKPPDPISINIYNKDQDPKTCKIDPAGDDCDCDEREKEKQKEISRNLNPDNIDLLSILFHYEYISKNQRDKLIEQCIFEDPKDLVDKLLTIYCLTQDELNEARVIMNLSKLRNRMVTRQEAINYILLKQRKLGGDGHEESVHQ
jgi:hypothetical protein